MTIQLMFFGQLAEITGTGTLELEAADTAALQQELHARFPRLATTPYRIAVDKKMITEPVSLHPKNVVALLPPFSGG
ncbi:MAG TPA: MoaD/ThiS family protein [Chitinophagaceae bacterium]|jgi:molybdopterin converting factor small subunit|nr:MoaD/ThiS family protein [Chitinophagaceae bacterium]